jgi:hypothetical protein
MTTVYVDPARFNTFSQFHEARIAAAKSAGVLTGKEPAKRREIQAESFRLYEEHLEEEKTASYFAEWDAEEKERRIYRRRCLSTVELRSLGWNDSRIKQQLGRPDGFDGLQFVGKQMPLYLVSRVHEIDPINSKRLAEIVVARILKSYPDKSQRPGGEIRYVKKLLRALPASDQAALLFELM